MSNRKDWIVRDMNLPLLFSVVQQ